MRTDKVVLLENGMLPVCACMHPLNEPDSTTLYSYDDKKGSESYRTAYLLRTVVDLEERTVTTRLEYIAHNLLLLLHISQQSQHQHQQPASAIMRIKRNQPPFDE